jgi:hypothetical protein
LPSRPARAAACRHTSVRGPTARRRRDVEGRAPLTAEIELPAGAVHPTQTSRPRDAVGLPLSSRRKLTPYRDLHSARLPPLCPSLRGAGRGRSGSPSRRRPPVAAPLGSERVTMRCTASVISSGEVARFIRTCPAPPVPNFGPELRATRPRSRKIADAYSMWRAGVSSTRVGLASAWPPSSGWGYGP